MVVGGGMWTFPCSCRWSQKLYAGRRKTGRKRESSNTLEIVLGAQQTPYGEAGEASTVTGRVHIASTEVEVVHIVIIVARRRPEVAAAALIVRRATVEEAREGQTKS